MKSAMLDMTFDLLASLAPLDRDQLLAQLDMYRAILAEQPAGDVDAVDLFCQVIDRVAATPAGWTMQ